MKYPGLTPPMRIRILSDLHLEFEAFSPPKLAVDVVVLAGDIDVGVRAVPGAGAVSDSDVVYVLGNHEYYRQAVPRHLHKLKALAGTSNVHVLENDSLVLGDVVFSGMHVVDGFRAVSETPRLQASTRHNA